MIPLFKKKKNCLFCLIFFCRDALKECRDTLSGNLGDERRNAAITNAVSRKENPSVAMVTPRSLCFDGGTNKIPSLKSIYVSAEKNNALYGNMERTLEIRETTSQSKKHVKLCDKQEAKFFRFLSENETFRRLADFHVDDVGRKKRIFYILLSGPKDDYKYDVLNMCLTVFAENLTKESVKKSQIRNAKNKNHEAAIKMLQPNTISTYFKALFAQFHRNGIEYTQLDYKNGGPGTYTAVVKGKMANACKHIDDYGRSPNRSDYDPEEDYKLRNCASPKWDFDNYDDILALTVWQVLTNFMLRGSREVRFCLFFVCFRSKFNFFMINFFCFSFIPANIVETVRFCY